MIKEFNEYGASKNITLEFTFLTEVNSSYDVNDYGAMINSLLYKRSTKYDIFIYFDIFNEVYAPHFIDLKKHLDDHFISTFLPELIERATFNNELKAVPCQVNTNVLYSNKQLLSKYGKKPPKTWEESSIPVFIYIIMKRVIIIIKIYYYIMEC